MNILEDQLEYYRARAAEYDQWFYRQGRYDRGAELNQLWHEEAALVRQALRAFNPAGSVLELACGTGIWTEQLALYADTILAVDAAAEMLEINRQKNAGKNIDYAQANLFEWEPPRKFDAIFFGFWLSHVPVEKFGSFWRTVGSALVDGGRVFFLDSLPSPDSRARNHEIADAAATRQVRYLNDGRKFEIIKRYYVPQDLTAQLEELGFDARIETTGEFFLYGVVTKQSPAA